MSDSRNETQSARPAWACKLIDQLRTARTGNGTIHNLIFRVALALVRTKQDDATIYKEIREAVAKCGRNVSEREIWQAITNARHIKRPSVNNMMRKNREESKSTNDTPALREGLVKSRKPAPSRTPKWPEVDTVLRDSIVSKGNGFKPLTTQIETDLIIDRLFPGNPPLCVGKSKYKFSTAPREEYRGTLGNLALIVPSPMTALTGLTKDGKISAHSLDNTGPRHFAVIEFDTGTIDEQLAIFWHLKNDQILPLVMLVFSGKKSIHGWFDCRGMPDGQVEAFYRYCVMIGADPITYTRSQFVRMPNGRRDNGARQEVLFFNL